jgi:hypothetical protein
VPDGTKEGVVQFRGGGWDVSVGNVELATPVLLEENLVRNRNLEFQFCRRLHLHSIVQLCEAES